MLILTPKPSNPNKFDGLLFCARFAFAPNRLKYCGPDRNRELLEYCAKSGRDQGLMEILQKFETMHPYLKMIGDANDIVDPFDKRVVEAYWIGNDLLKHAGLKNLFNHVVNAKNFNLKNTPRELDRVSETIKHGGLPHHSFHVLTIFKRTGHLPEVHTLETINECKISWGKVKFLDGPKITVETTPIVHVNGKLLLGTPITRTILKQIGDETLIKDLKKDDWVAFHWGVICIRLTPFQLRNLKKYTLMNIQLANNTISNYF